MEHLHHPQNFLPCPSLVSLLSHLLSLAINDLLYWCYGFAFSRLLSKCNLIICHLLCLFSVTQHNALEIYLLLNVSVVCFFLLLSNILLCGYPPADALLGCVQFAATEH